MLFNSLPFIFVFLPLVIAGHALLAARGSQRLGVVWLILASVCFYAWWRPAHVLLLGFSVVANYSVGLALRRQLAESLGRKRVLALGVAFNLLLLGYFKYAGFLGRGLNALAGAHVEFGEVVLPLAISFFTFQQIAYLVDVYRGEVEDYRFIDYALFVTFFPQLVAGPIVHHGEIVPQFARRLVQGLQAQDVAVGLTVFSIGLFKKVVVADNVEPIASVVFDAAQGGAVMGFVEAWVGALAYGFQIYFDFSGYSDMAIGLGMLFGIRLPVNFKAPYRSASIVEFWRRWHVTLSRFLREYLYFPLGGNRLGNARRYVNLMLTMLLGGLWHGAGWTFVFWGGLHGVYLIVNHAWSGLVGSRVRAPLAVRRLARPVSVLMTFGCVTVAWVFFRAESFGAAFAIVGGMLGLRGLGLGALGALSRPAAWAPALLAWVWFLPTSQDMVAAFLPVLDGESRESGDGGSRRLRQALSWRPSLRWALWFGAVTVVGLSYLTRVHEFVYYQF